MALKIEESPWARLVQWAQIGQKNSAYQCFRDVQSLIEWETGTGPISRAWQCLTYFSTKEPLNTDDEKFEALKRRLLDYVEAVPEETSLSITQMDEIRTQIEKNETLAQMWNCTKQYYSVLARKGEVNNEFPDYAFGCTFFGSLAVRVKAIQAQIDSLNRPRSEAFETATAWLLRNTTLTYANMPKIISQEFTNITFLDMSHNKFITLGDFSRLNKLKGFNLSDNCLGEIPANHLPLSLEKLSLNQNWFDQQPNLTYLIALKYLSISDNPCSERLKPSLLPHNLDQVCAISPFK